MASDPEKIVIRLNTQLIGKILKGLFALGVLIFVFDLVIGLHTSRITRQTAGYLNENMTALAYEEIDPYRERFVKDAPGCRLLLTVYMETKHVEKMEWAFESCRKNHVDVVEMPIARAQVLLAEGQTEEAIALLRDLKRAKNSSAYMMLVDTLMRQKRGPEAEEEAEGAVKMFPDSRPVREMAMHIHGALGHWTEAARLAVDFKEAAFSGRIHGPFAGFLAMIFEKTGDKESLGRLRQALEKSEEGRSRPSASAPATATTAPPDSSARPATQTEPPSH